MCGCSAVHNLTWPCPPRQPSRPYPSDRKLAANPSLTPATRSMEPEERHNRKSLCLYHVLASLHETFWWLVTESLWLWCVAIHKHNQRKSHLTNKTRPWTTDRIIVWISFFWLYKCSTSGNCDNDNGLEMGAGYPQYKYLTVGYNHQTEEFIGLMWPFPQRQEKEPGQWKKNGWQSTTNLPAIFSVLRKCIAIFFILLHTWIKSKELFKWMKRESLRSLQDEIVAI